MKINLFKFLQLIVVLIIFTPVSTFAITSSINTCKFITPDDSLLYGSTLSGLKDTLEPNNFSFHDRKSQAKAIRKVKHEYFLASREERKKTKKDDFGVVLVLVSIIPFVLFAFAGYQFCSELD